MTTRYRLESRLWGLSAPIRRLARAWARSASAWRHRLRGGETRVVFPTRTEPTEALPDVAISVSTADRKGLGRSTWNAWSEDDTAPFHLSIDGDPAELPETTVELLMLSAVAEDMPVVAFESPAARAVLTRPPRPGEKGPALVGRRLRWPDRVSPRSNIAGSARPLQAIGDHQSIPSDQAAPVVSGTLRDPAVALARRPDSASAGIGDERRAACFVLPYLAVGGAERLLFDLLDGWSDRRLLVVTLDPHRAELGSAVERCRQITPWVYPLGETLPRAARWPAMVHLLRHHRVESLVSWNGTVDFYDRVAELPTQLPDLRILAQLYHHRGGWAARTSPAAVRAIDLHLAVNRALQHALLVEREVPENRVELVHHGVPIPDEAASSPSSDSRPELRRRLGLPAEALVIGTFIRLHAQKRPLDVIELARRIKVDGAARPVFFLLVGGGPMEDEVDRAASNVDNVVRLPLVADARPFYAAVDLCLMTSSYEGLPVFLLDALARQIPVVAPAVGDIPLLAADGGALVVEDVGDLDGLEAALRRFFDDDNRRRAGAAGRKTVIDRFGLDHYRRAYDALIFPPRPA